MVRIHLDRERTLRLTRRAAYQLSVLRTLEPGGPGIGNYAGVCQAVFALQDPDEKPLLKSPEEVADHLSFARLDEASAAVVAAFEASEDFAALGGEKKSTSKNAPSPDSNSD
jgi:hypothetical protein